MALLKKFNAPALPLPSELYDRRTADELIRTLRLYFNQLDDLLTTLSNPLGAALFKPTDSPVFQYPRSTGGSY
jgi:hypothetical protein